MGILLWGWKPLNALLIINKPICKLFKNKQNSKKMSKQRYTKTNLLAQPLGRPLIEPAEKPIMFLNWLFIYLIITYFFVIAMYLGNNLKINIR